MLQQTREPQHALWLHRFFVVGLAVAAAFLLVHFVDLIVFAIPDHDQTWLLYAAKRVASGVQLDGPRLVETNPPLIIWVSLIPVLLAKLFHVRPAAMLNACVGVLVVGSTAWSVRVLRVAGVLTGQVLLFVGVCITLLAETLVTNADIGQREQLVVILLLPYVFSAASGAAAHLSIVELCALGVVGGVGICLKPQEVLALACFEIFLALGTRSLRRLARPDFLALFLTACLYLLLVRWITPLYLSHTVPLLGATYWAFGEDTVRTLAGGSPAFFAIFLIALVSCFVLRRRLRHGTLPWGLLGCTTGATIAYLQQHTGWGNHEFPQTAFLILAVSLIAIDLLSSFVAKVAQWQLFSLTFFAIAGVCTLVLLPIVIVHRGHVAAFAASHESLVETTLRTYPAGTPVYVLSTGLDGFPSVLRHDLLWGSRYVHLWMLPALAKNEAFEHGGPAPVKVLSPEVLSRISALQRREMTEDLQLWKPAVIIVKLCRPEGVCQAMTGLPFDTIGWFFQDPAFAAEWAKYQKQAGDGYYDVYTRNR